MKANSMVNKTQYLFSLDKGERERWKGGGRVAWKCEGEKDREENCGEEERPDMIMQ